MSSLKVSDREDGIVWLFAASLIIALALLFFMHSEEVLPFLAPILLIIGFLSMMLQKFTIRITEDELEFFFGPGLFKSRYALKDIVPTRIIDVDPLFATGIRMFQGGWLYGIKGNAAVELQRADGMPLYLRSTGAEEVFQVLRQSGMS